MFLNLGLGRMGCLAGALAASSLALDLNFIDGSAFSSLITFTRASTATYYDAAGQRQTASSGSPRIDYNPATLAIRGLLIEEQRTNLALQSGTESDAAWTKTATTIGTGATGLDGVTASRRMTSSSTTPLLAQGSITVTASTTYTYSVFLRYVDTNWLRIQYMDSTFTNGVRAWVNLNGGGAAALGTVANIGTGSGGAHTLTSLGGGWYLYTLTGMASTATAAGPSIRPVTADVSSTGVSGVSYDADGHQLEAGSFATSYIPTTGTSATRAADVAVVSGANFSGFYNSAAGAFVVSGHTTDSFSGVTRRLMEVNNGTAGERFIVGLQNATTARFLVSDGAATVADVGIAVTSMPARVVIAGSYAANDVKAAANGAAGTADTSVTLPTVTQMVIGADLASPTATQMANGHIERIRYYNRALSQAELNALTA